MRKLVFVLPLFMLLACGNDAEKEGREPVKLTTEDEKLSYAIGADEAANIINSQDPNIDRFDFEAMVKGFREGFKPGFVGDKSNPCVLTIQNMYGGAQGMDFDTTYLEEGCNCIGQFTGGMLYKNLAEVEAISRMKKELIIRGFEDGLHKVDTALTVEQKQEVLTKFAQELQQRSMAKAQLKWDEIKKIDGIRELENGVYIETLKEGTGKKPARTDDVEVSYYLTDIMGTFLQNSEDFGEHFKTNLSSALYPGWVTGLLEMQKGGKYRIYVPAPVADGKQDLIFEMELFKIGPAGSIVKPQPTAPPAQ